MGSPVGRLGRVSISQHGLGSRASVAAAPRRTNVSAPSTSTLINNRLPGQRLVVFSDGVVEQSRPDGDGAMFGVEGAIHAIAGCGSECDDVERIFEAVLRHAKGPNLADDTTVASVVIE